MNTERAMGPLAFGLAYSLPGLLLAGISIGGWAYYLVPAFVFGLLPFMDQIVGTYLHNPETQETQDLLNNPAYKWVAAAFVPVQVLMVVGGAYLFAMGGLAPFEQIGLLLSVGICTGGIGITLAHEFLHKTTRSERLYSKILLLMVSYMHFYIEHLKGHHRRVATPEDPASARYGESFYSFYGRTMVGSFTDAWALEKNRLKKVKVSFWHWRNQMLWFTGLPVALAAVLGLCFGWQASVFFVVQSWLAMTLLEMVNYVEHYGLTRKEIRPGIYERVQVEHSWNSNHTLTNCLLFMLQRHSDHHAHQSRRYQILRQFDESPQLPAGYPTMILLALVPPLWKSVMHQRLDAYEKRRSQLAT